MTYSEFLNEFENVPLEFISYASHSFSFRGIKDNYTIEATVSGKDNIYDLSIQPTKKFTIKEISPTKVRLFQYGNKIEEFGE